MARFLDIFEFVSVLLHALSYAGLALTAGGIIFLAAVVRRPADAPMATAAVCSWSSRSAWFLAAVELARTILTTIILASTLQLPVRALAGADYLTAGALTAGLSVGIAVLVRRTPLRVGPLVCAVAALFVTSVMTSHAAARISGRTWLATLTVMHAASVAAWIGGLPFLWIATRTRRCLEASLLVRRFSRLAMVSVAVLAASGLALSWAYIRTPSALYGTAYGYMVCTKAVLFAFALTAGAFNRQIVARLSNEAPVLLSRLRCLTETEIGIGFTVLLAAASLTSQPPAVDLQSGRLTAAEIALRFRPRFPRITSPPVTALAPVSSSPEPVASKISAAPFTPQNGDADIAWSEYNHHWSGIIVAVAGLLALLCRTGRARWAVHWPLAFLGLAVFLVLRADPENWPLGPRSFWGSFLVPEVLQHRFFAALVAVLAIFEWRVRRGRASRTSAALVFPLLCAVGGALLLTHNHSLANVKEELLAEMSHTPIAVAAVAAGWGRWLELRLPRNSGVFGWVWPASLVFIGAVLMLYREA